MEETASLALLESHLSQTSRLATRMTSILTSLDSRLSKLDKSINPFGIGPLKVEESNLLEGLRILEGVGAGEQGVSSENGKGKRPAGGSSTTRSIPTTSSTLPVNHSSSSSSFRPPTAGNSNSTTTIPLSSTPHVNLSSQDSALLNSQPSFSGLDEFVGAMERVIKEFGRLERNGLRGTEKGREGLANLIDLSTRSLTSLFLNHVRSGSSHPIGFPSLNNPTISPTSILTTYPIVTQILSRIRGLLSSSGASGSIPVGRSISTSIEGCFLGYCSIRKETIIQQALQPILHEMEKIINAPVSPGQEDSNRREKAMSMGKMFTGVIDWMGGEAGVLGGLFGEDEGVIKGVDLPHGMEEIFGTSIFLINETMNKEIVTIKKTLSSSTFYAFELYQTLSSIQPKWEQNIQGYVIPPPAEQPIPTEEQRKMMGIVGEGVGMLRQVCLRSFPEVLVDVKMGGAGTNAVGRGEIQAGVAEITYKVVAYLETLPSYESLTIDLLTQVGEGNWRMGAAGIPQTNAEDGILQSYVRDLLAGLIDQLKSRSRTMQPPISGTFLLNNVSYMRNDLILSNSAAGDVLGVGAEDLLNSAFREAKGIYMSAWQDLASLVSEEKSHQQPQSRFKDLAGGGEKTMVRDNLGQFYERLDQLEGLARQHQISRKDPGLRDKLSAEVRELVVGQMSAFVQKHNRVVEKYMRASTSDVDRKLANIFA